MDILLLQNSSNISRWRARTPSPVVLKESNDVTVESESKLLKRQHGIPLPMLQLYKAATITFDWELLHLVFTSGECYLPTNQYIAWSDQLEANNGTLLCWCDDAPAYAAGILFFKDTATFLLNCERATLDEKTRITCPPNIVESVDDPFLFYLTTYCFAEIHRVLQVVTCGGAKTGLKAKALLRLYPTECSSDLNSSPRLTSNKFVPVQHRQPHREEEQLGKSHPQLLQRMISYQWFRLEYYVNAIVSSLKSYSKARQFPRAVGTYFKRVRAIQSSWKSFMTRVRIKRDNQRTVTMRRTAALLKAGHQVSAESPKSENVSLLPLPPSGALNCGPRRQPSNRVSFARSDIRLPSISSPILTSGTPKFDRRSNHFTSSSRPHF